MAEEVKPRRRRAGLTRLSSKNQVTIPVAALRAAGVGVGDELHVEADGDGRLVLVREREPLDAGSCWPLSGCGPSTPRSPTRRPGCGRNTPRCDYPTPWCWRRPRSRTAKR